MLGKHKSDLSTWICLDLLGDPDMEEVFSESHEDLENTSQQLYSSLPPPSTYVWKHYPLKHLKMSPLNGNPTVLERRD